MFFRKLPLIALIILIVQGCIPALTHKYIEDGYNPNGDMLGKYNYSTRKAPSEMPLNDLNYYVETSKLYFHVPANTLIYPPKNYVENKKDDYYTLTYKLLPYIFERGLRHWDLWKKTGEHINLRIAYLDITQGIDVYNKEKGQKTLIGRINKAPDYATCFKNYNSLKQSMITVFKEESKFNKGTKDTLTSSLANCQAKKEFHELYPKVKNVYSQFGSKKSKNGIFSQLANLGVLTTVGLSIVGSKMVAMTAESRKENPYNLYINVEDGRWISNTAKKFTIEIKGDKSTGYISQKDSSGNAWYQSGAKFSFLKKGNYEIKAYGIDSQEKEVFSLQGNVYIDGSTITQDCVLYAKAKRIECKHY